MYKKCFHLLIKTQIVWKLKLVCLFVCWLVDFFNDVSTLSGHLTPN